MNNTNAIPTYVRKRIRQPIPPGSMVVPGSTPVVAFGNARGATVATLGLNPSPVEFLDRHGHELTESQRRLETCRSLGVAQLADAPDDAVERVVAGCDGYFQRNPYWRWFRRLEQVLQDVGASYLDGSACHLDLIQWATDPVWGKLPPATRQSLIADDAAFLRQQLTKEEPSAPDPEERDRAAQIDDVDSVDLAPLTARSLSEYRQERGMHIPAFTAFLGITHQEYAHVIYRQPLDRRVRD